MQIMFFKLAPVLSDAAHADIVKRQPSSTE